MNWMTLRHKISASSHHLLPLVDAASWRRLLVSVGALLPSCVRRILTRVTVTYRTTRLHPRVVISVYIQNFFLSFHHHHERRYSQTLRPPWFHQRPRSLRKERPLESRILEYPDHRARYFPASLCASGSQWSSRAAPISPAFPQANGKQSKLPAAESKFCRSPAAGASQFRVFVVRSATPAAQSRWRWRIPASAPRFAPSHNIGPSFFKTASVPGAVA